MNKIERGEIAFSRFFADIAKTLKMPEEALKTPHAFLAHDGSLLLPEPDQAKPLGTTNGSERGLPLFISFTGAEGAMMLTPEPIGTTGASQVNSLLQTAYAVVVSTDTMAPAYEVGDMIWVNPLLTADTHRDVLLRRTASGGEVVLARLLDHTETHWMVLEHNRDRKASRRKLLRKDYPHCHRIVGKLCR